jgi:dsDNA-binding SOS-regulon protein
VGNIDFKPGLIQLLPRFHGLDSESAYLHIKEFEEVIATINYDNVTKDTIKLKLFHFSLKEKAKSWLHSLRPRSIGTWAEMTREFLKKFFPTHRTNALRRAIMNFAQKEEEAFFQCWERYNELLNACPRHGYERWRLISFFYDGLNSTMRQFVEMMCNGEFMNKEADEAWDYLEELAESAQSWDTSKPTNSKTGQQKEKGGMYVLSEEDSISARLASLTRKVEAMELRKGETINSTEVETVCEICAGTQHTTQDCPTISAFQGILQEQTNAINSYQQHYGAPNSNTFNPNWKNHPNFSWRNGPIANTNNTPKVSLEEMLGAFVSV